MLCRTDTFSKTQALLSFSLMLTVATTFSHHAGDPNRTQKILAGVLVPVLVLLGITALWFGYVTWYKPRRDYRRKEGKARPGAGRVKDTEAGSALRGPDSGDDGEGGFRRDDVTAPGRDQRVGAGTRNLQQVPSDVSYATAQSMSYGEEDMPARTITTATAAAPGTTATSVAAATAAAAILAGAGAARGGEIAAAGGEGLDRTRTVHRDASSSEQPLRATTTASSPVAPKLEPTEERVTPGDRSLVTPVPSDMSTAGSPAPTIWSVASGGVAAVDNNKQYQQQRTFESIPSSSDWPPPVPRPNSAAGSVSLRGSIDEPSPSRVVQVQRSVTPTPSAAAAAAAAGGGGGGTSAGPSKGRAWWWVPGWFGRGQGNTKDLEVGNAEEVGTLRSKFDKSASFSTEHESVGTLEAAALAAALQRKAPGGGSRGISSFDPEAQEGEALGLTETNSGRLKQLPSLTRKLSPQSSVAAKAGADLVRKLSSGTEGLGPKVLTPGGHIAGGTKDATTRAPSPLSAKRPPKSPASAKRLQMEGVVPSPTSSGAIPAAGAGAGPSSQEIPAALVAAEVVPAVVPMTLSKGTRALEEAVQELRGGTMVSPATTTPAAAAAVPAAPQDGGDGGQGGTEAGRGGGGGSGAAVAAIAAAGAAEAAEMRRRAWEAAAAGGAAEETGAAPVVTQMEPITPQPTASPGTLASYELSGIDFGDDKRAGLSPFVAGPGGPGVGRGGGGREGQRSVQEVLGRGVSEGGLDGRAGSGKVYWGSRDDDALAEQYALMLDSGEHGLSAGFIAEEVGGAAGAADAQRKEQGGTNLSPGDTSAPGVTSRQLQVLPQQEQQRPGTFRPLDEDELREKLSKLPQQPSDAISPMTSYASEGEERTKAEFRGLKKELRGILKVVGLGGKGGSESSAGAPAAAAVGSGLEAAGAAQRGADAPASGGSGVKGKRQHGLVSEVVSPASAVTAVTPSVSGEPRVTTAVSASGREEGIRSAPAAGVQGEAPVSPALVPPGLPRAPTTTLSTAAGSEGAAEAPASLRKSSSGGAVAARVRAAEEAAKESAKTFSRSSTAGSSSSTAAAGAGSGFGGVTLKPTGLSGPVVVPEQGLQSAARRSGALEPQYVSPSASKPAMKPATHVTASKAVGLPSGLGSTGSGGSSTRSGKAVAAVAAATAAAAGGDSGDVGGAGGPGGRLAPIRVSELPRRAETASEGSEVSGVHSL